jgi:tRNA threonylcarbamoyladenosine biosynthesis protein TsaE
VKAPATGVPGVQRVMTEAELVDWGHGFGAGTPAGRYVLTLSGDLGAGKTTLVRAICSGYGVTEDVTSPTYAIVHKYASTKSPVYHLDLYRLESPKDLQNIGFDEIVESVSLVLIEWPKVAERAIPKVAINVHLEMIDGDESRRRLTLNAPYAKRSWWSL